MLKYPFTLTFLLIERLLFDKTWIIHSVCIWYFDVIKKFNLQNIFSLRSKLYIIFTIKRHPD